ncbi:MAG: hypothetical protein PHT54_02695 [Candidatus Nanoarchaeia archaeon]|nr:hypothetical protein [Candidatus Nanoarchaeia archaeon]
MSKTFNADVRFLEDGTVQISDEFCKINGTVKNWNDFLKDPSKTNPEFIMVSHSEFNAVKILGTNGNPVWMPNAQFDQLQAEAKAP